MAKFRMIQTGFWNDPKVMEEMTPEDKFFFMYLLTNPQVTQIGIFRITKKQVAFETGFSVETVQLLFERFLHQHQLIRYNNETRELAIKNWGKYNLRRGGKPMLDCIRKELVAVKDRSFIEFVGQGVTNESIRGLFAFFYPENDNTSTLRGQEEEKEEEQEQQEQQEHQQEHHQQQTDRGTGPSPSGYNRLKQARAVICEMSELALKNRDPPFHLERQFHS
ncbi:hypothetical protein [Halalkalibacter okhensis]|uniref:hypothetical protein n=1 Tax=Halalkalibacter okhensis TaxID=333138 RepID=UPI00068CF04B|nr:hypothetical protein [Halalkalibacter okhensis]